MLEPTIMAIFRHQKIDLMEPLQINKQLMNIVSIAPRKVATKAGFRHTVSGSLSSLRHHLQCHAWNALLGRGRVSDDLNRISTRDASPRCLV